MRIFLLGLLVFSAFLVFSLTLATGNTTKMGDYFWLFFSVNGFLLITLVVFVLKQLWVLRRNIKDNVFGSKLTRRLMSAFSLVTVLPSFFLLLVSSQFISHSINSWFGESIGNSFDKGIRLGQVVLDERLQRTKFDALEARDKVLAVDSDEEALLSALYHVKQQASASGIVIYNLKDKKIIARVGSIETLDPNVNKEVNDNFIKNGWAGTIEREHEDMYTQVLLPFHKGVNNNSVFLFEQKIPSAIVSDALALEESRAQYSQLSYAKNAMQTTYLMTLVIVTLLAIMLALVCALFFAKKFLAPLQALSAGTKAVAQGDFSRRSPIFREDEMGILSNSFNRMTEQLAEAKEEQESSKTFLENVLESLSTGVIVFDTKHCVRMVNESAQAIIELDFKRFDNQPFLEWGKIEPLSIPFVQVVTTILDEPDSKGGVQVDYPHDSILHVLFGKIIDLPDHVGGGYMLVFDEITELVKAQKNAAWGEVAKRLAHEIRNPLTPIQLSAERLAMKLKPKLAEADANMLIRSTDTIVKQVAALKAMVEAFRNYARSPSTNLQKIDLNVILNEVLVLYESYNCNITLKLSNMPLYVMADVAMLRQVIHNLLQNAHDATKENPDPQVSVITLAQDNKAVLIIEDNGDGFEEQILNKAFEPYITNKATGTGLGLAVVKKIIMEHNGEISIGNKEEGGAMITIALPILEV